MHVRGCSCVSWCILFRCCSRTNGRRFILTSAKEGVFSFCASLVRRINTKNILVELPQNLVEGSSVRHERTHTISFLWNIIFCWLEQTSCQLCVCVCVCGCGGGWVCGCVCVLSLYCSVSEVCPQSGRPLDASVTVQQHLPVGQTSPTTPGLTQRLSPQLRSPD